LAILFLTAFPIAVEWFRRRRRHDSEDDTEDDTGGGTEHREPATEDPAPSPS
jgi:hypothetical protein